MVSSFKRKGRPYSSKLYDDLEFLENLEFLESEAEGEATKRKLLKSTSLDFDELMGGRDAANEERTCDVYEERRFKLTNKGRKFIERIIENKDFKPIADAVRGSNPSTEVIH